MNIVEIKNKIDTQIVGKKILFFEEVHSTNKYLYQLALDRNLDDGTVLISDSQTAGKGRLERSWVSPKGKNLYISILLRPNISPKTVSIFTFLASCALKETFDGYGVGSKIKWPNDILVQSKKISGVLTELKLNKNIVDYLIVGIGVNINMDSDLILNLMPDISYKVTSLSIELDRAVEREEFAAELINNIDKYYIRFIKSGISKILSDWTKLWGAIGSMVEVVDGNNIYKGIAEKVDENGFLYIRKDDGRLEKVITGDFSF